MTEDCMNALEILVDLTAKWFCVGATSEVESCLKFPYLLYVSQDCSRVVFQFPVIFKSLVTAVWFGFVPTHNTTE